MRRLRLPLNSAVSFKGKLMKLKSISIIVLLCLMACPLMLCSRLDSNKTNSQVSSAQKDNLPVYFPIGEVKYYSRGDSVTGVFYSTKLPYSEEVAEIVLDFYDKKMTQLDFRPFVEDYYKYADRKWSESFIDATQKGSPHIVQLNASWADESKSKRANLNLRYYWYVDDKQYPIVLGANDDLKVDFQLSPFVVLPPPTKVRN
jgi:hypothetical protein